MLNTAIPNYRNAFKRIGYAGFIFFFVKGLCWLLVPVVLTWYAA